MYLTPQSTTTDGQENNDVALGPALPENQIVAARFCPIYCHGAWLISSARPSKLLL